ncbi:chemotaxis protein CheB [Methanobacterium sp. MBAC-LM]|uniref:chemotaxis protein CheB n=1 Tax=Methanobacterium sp. MBAC-LM TaxID=3412034 RepID=UPI003C761650
MANQGKNKLKDDPKEEKKIPVVGVGSSAGGLEALGKMFSNMPSDSGLGFVLIQHLDPAHKSSMAELLSRYTNMEVLEIEDGMHIEPNKLYVTPPNKNVGIIDDVLHLAVPKEPHGLRRPIDFFFQSLADNLEEYAIGIILSGFGSDGTIGIRAIKSMGGMVIAQDPDSAVSGSMPSSAIDTDLVDYIAPPEKIPENLISYVKRIGKKPPKRIIGKDEETLSSLQKILILIRNRTGHDFSLYKESTINRRIARRMNVHQIDKVSDYLTYIQQHPKEVNTLFKELLINVTSFFRDPAAFKAFQKHVISEVLDKKIDGSKVRIWVPGCSTGEEVYSIAMIIQEYMDKSGKHLEVQLFGTDIDEDAIDIARAATYPSTIVKEVDSDRLHRFFTKKGEGYKVKKSIREMAIFAPHDVLINPPFSKLDTISCRNVLIYMNKDAQKKILSAFNYALKPGGIMLLGPSESISNFVESFTTLDNKWKIYKSKKTDYAPAGDFVRFPYARLPQDYTTAEDLEILGKTDSNISKNVEKLLIERYAPPTVMVNNDGRIIFIHGKVGKYLEPAEGIANLSIIDMAREGIKFELNSAINEAILKNKEVEYKKLDVKTNGDYQTINLTVKPINQPKMMESLLMVTFKDIEPLKKEIEKLPETTPKKDKRIKELEEELRVTKERLHTTIEELETSNEELKSANEELQSMNEELQSTNEELETSKEELQSLNEELLTVNTELQNKVDQLSEVNDDMNNLLNSIEIPTIFVDKDIKIKRFTKETTKLINLIPSDVGRPLEDIASNVEYEGMINDIKEVMDRVIYREKEVSTKDGRCYLVRIIPYKTLENIIDGAVITFTDISEQKEVQKLAGQLEYVKNIVDTVREPLIVLDNELKVISANESFYGKFKVEEETTEGELFYRLGDNQWDIPQLKELLEKVLPKNQKFESFIVEHDFPKIGHKKMLLNGQQLQEKRIGDRTIGKGLILLAIEDVTDNPEYQKNR